MSHLTEFAAATNFETSNVVTIIIKCAFAELLNETDGFGWCFNFCFFWLITLTLALFYKALKFGNLSVFTLSLKLTVALSTRFSDQTQRFQFSLYVKNKEVFRFELYSGLLILPHQLFLYFHHTDFVTSSGANFLLR